MKKSYTHIPTISIVTPSYNQGQFLEETIESVISQEGDFFIEYFIMDGGSTDNSVDVITKYDRLLANKKWPAIKCHGVTYQWVSEKDKGQTDAINKGFLKSTGDIVSYINSDDLYAPGAFSVVADYFAKHPEHEFLYGDGDVIDENGNVQWEWLSRPYDLKVLTSYHFRWHDFTNYIMQQSTFWQRKVFDSIGYLDVSFHYAMDIEYWIRAGSNGLKMKHIPIKLGKFRLIEGTKSLSSPTVFWSEQLEIFRRYNSKKMKSFMTEYFFCEGKHNGFNIESSYDKQHKVFERWKKLSIQEQNTLKHNAEKGFQIACLMLANKAFLQGESEKATSIFRKVLSKRTLLILHPLSVLFFLKKIWGRKISVLLSTLYHRLICYYRSWRYYYRYRQKRY